MLELRSARNQYGDRLNQNLAALLAYIIACSAVNVYGPLSAVALLGRCRDLSASNGRCLQRTLTACVGMPHGQHLHYIRL